MSTSSRLSSRLRSALLSACAVTFVVCTGIACSGGGDDAAGDQQPLPGSQPKQERWIVAFKDDGPDLAAYRKAVKEDPAAAPALVASLREQQKKAHADFAGTVDSVSGKVVDWWWMSNAATIEIDPSALPTIKKADSVKSVSPDRLLE